MPLKRVCVAMLLAAQSTTASAQSVSGKGSTSPESRSATGAHPLIGCPSLANLRMVLKQTGGNVAAAIPIITNPRSDLGCAVLDPASVTNVTDHVSLNDQSYECLLARGTTICFWTLAGSLPPTTKPPASRNDSTSPPSAGKPRR